MRKRVPFDFQGAAFARTNMKNQYSVRLLIAAVSFATAGHMSAAAIVGSAYEDFDYATGAIGTKSGGTGFNATGSGTVGNTAYRGSGGSVIVTTGSLSFASTGYAASSGEKLALSGTGGSSQVFRDVGQTVNSGTLYFSFLAQRTNTTNRSTNVAFFAAPNATTNETFAIGQFGAANGTGLNSSGNIGLTYTNSTLISAAAPIAFGTNTTHLIIGRIDFDAFAGGLDQITLWVDPSDVTSEPVTPYLQTTAANSTNITALAVFRPFAGTSAGGSANPSVTAAYDEFRFGGTFGSVVPEPGSAVLVLLGGLVGLTRRKR